MPAAAIDKVIITHKEALKKKYLAAGWTAIHTELKSLIVADATRGLATILVDLSSSADATKYGFTAIPFAQVDNAKKHKQAIDLIYNAAKQPAYLMLLGAVDVIPHVPLENPVHSPGVDDDHTADSDLPYACSAAYSTDPRKFIAPERVVGRLPDLTGGSDPTYLVGLIKVASQYKPRPKSDYDAYMGVTAAVWSNSTEMSLDATFGGHADMQKSPPVDFPGTSLTHLDRLSHFINCHGNRATPQFSGEDAFGYPNALHASQLAGAVKEGAIVAAECCYGAELYNPALTTHAGICNSYLKEKAYAFFGSSTISYGPAVGNGQADLICQYFLQHVRAGASVGRACLLARLDFVKSLGSVVTGTDLKTVAQFNLLGDPALTPVAATAAPLGGTETKLIKPLPKGLAGDAAAVATRFLIDRFTRDGRREWLRHYSEAMTTVAAVVADAVVTSFTGPKIKATGGNPAVAKALREVAAEMGLTEPTVLRFEFGGQKTKRPATKKAVKSKAKPKTAPSPLPTSSCVHLVIERKNPTGSENAILIQGFEAIELEGVLTVRKFVSR